MSNNFEILPDDAHALIGLSTRLRAIEENIKHLATRIGVLEKKVIEPEAQSLVNRVGSAYRPIAQDCPHCKRPMK